MSFRGDAKASNPESRDDGSRFRVQPCGLPRNDSVEQRESAMHAPSITAFYLAILALIYAVLALRVAGLRRANLALFGDAENAKLRTAIRVHANFIEYV